MTKENSQSPSVWLAELEAQSRQKQQDFMAKIAGKLNRERIHVKPEHPYRGAPAYWNEVNWSQQERIQQFTNNFQAAGGYVERLAEMDQAKEFIAAKAIELKARRILCQNEPALNQDDWWSTKLQDTEWIIWNSTKDRDWREQAAEADIGIVMADYAAAYTGSLAVRSSIHKGRSVSLLPAVLIAILPADRLYTRLGEILTQFDETGREQLPAGIHFISGPSRSADIENDLTIGVHGPGIVYTLIVDQM